MRRHLRRTAVACAAAAALTAQASTWDAPLPPPQLKASPRLQETLPPETRGQLPTYVQADHFEGQTDIRARLKGHVQLRRGDTVIRADEAHQAPKLGDVIHVIPRPDRLHYFDAATGKRKDA